jgi:hypothetical protein
MRHSSGWVSGQQRVGEIGPERLERTDGSFYGNAIETPDPT